MESGAVFQAPRTSPTLPVGVCERNAVLNEENGRGQEQAVVDYICAWKDSTNRTKL